MPGARSQSKGLQPFSHCSGFHVLRTPELVSHSSLSDLRTRLCVMLREEQRPKPCITGFPNVTF
jgi:hypothetical protein